MLGLFFLGLAASTINPEPVWVCDGCQPAEAYLDPVDRQLAEGGPPVGDRIGPCTILKKQEYRDGILHQEVESIPLDRCVKMEPAKIWRGLWLNEFEGSQFCPGALASCTRDTEPRIWLSLHRQKSDGFKPIYGSLYEIEFTGRMTAYQGHYGHFGLSDHEVIVDRIISVKLVRGPPPPTKADLEFIRKDCLATPSCANDKGMMKQIDDALKKADS